MTNPIDPVTPPPGPAMADRLRLVGRLQAQALDRDDPLAANVGVIAGDVAMFVHHWADRARARIAGPGGAAPPVSEETEMILKMVRQYDRLVHLEQRWAEGRGRGE
jgi:hypothetical protein